MNFDNLLDWQKEEIENAIVWLGIDKSEARNVDICEDGKVHWNLVQIVANIETEVRK
jgi:hypothetical protein